MYVNQPFWSVDTMFYTEMKLPNVAKFVYHFVKAKDLASMNAGSAVPSMTTDILNAMEVVIPSASALEEFESLVAPMYEAMEQTMFNRKHCPKCVIHCCRSSCPARSMSLTSNSKPLNYRLSFRCFNFGIKAIQHSSNSFLVADI